MSYFLTIKNAPFSPQLIIPLTRVYEFKGRESQNIELLKQNIKVIKETTIQNDAIYSGHLLHIDLSQQRYKLLVREDIKPSNRKEKLIDNLLKSFRIIHEAESNWKMTTNGVIELFEFIFLDYDPNATLRKKRNRLEKRQLLDNLIQQFNKVIQEEEVEYITLFCAFIIDFINLRIFDDYNELIGLILLILLFKQYGFKIVDHESFFLTIAETESQFIEALNKSSVNWEIGLPQYHFFTRYIVDTLIAMYERFEKVCENFQFDRRYSKEELVEQIIYSFKEKFSKEDIRKQNPFVSDSTINRTLKRLKDEGVIEPLGKGRSAKWQRTRREF